MDRSERINKRCTSCLRGIYQNRSVCPSCGGSVVDVPHAKRVDRNRFHARRVFCGSCEHWKTETATTRAGCGLLEKPCSVEHRWLMDRADWCPDGRDVLTEFSDPQQEPITEIFAVTSLSPNDYHKTRQSVCLKTWKLFGLHVVSVNTPAEIEVMSKMYAEVDEWIPSRPTTSVYPRPTQRIKTLAKTSESLGRPALVINSDIEIHGSQSELLNRVGKDNTLVAGIRQNYAYNPHEASIEKWGIDAFVITPEMSTTLEDIGLEIGRPVWDYWIPLHFRKLGYNLDFIGDPLFYHKQHKNLWTQREWDLGASLVIAKYGDDELGFHSALGFRLSLPFPPGS